MSLKFVTKKLEGQSLDEELNGRTEREVEDSGTESDDETEPEPGEGDSDNVDSGISLNLRSASKLGGKSRQLPPLTKEPAAAAPLVDSMPPRPLETEMDDNDNHSSEEELEDIIGNSATKKVYVSEPAATSVKVSAAGRTSAVEKRKWSEVDHSTGGNTGNRTGSGSSGDDEVSGYMDGSYTPVQFCTSPPLNVYKPRRSQSPPPKLFHLASNGWDKAPANQTCFREGQRPSGAFRPKVLGAGVVPTRGSNLEEEGEEEDRTPNKRHRTTPRPHNIQRPCLDFEKMQQIKTKVVTSWRQGAELSLFCW